jgi:hypothetical protein
MLRNARRAGREALRPALQPSGVRRTGEAGGDESQEIAIAFGEYMKIKFQKKIMMILLILSDINCLQKRTMNS